MDGELLQCVIDVARSYSVDLSIYDEAFLEKSIARICDAAGRKDYAAYCEDLKKDRREAEALFQSMRISYSRFFREPLLFALLEQRVLPGIIQRASEGSEIRAWSAGCSCGQEAYSLAILLDEQIKSSGKRLRYRIFATDVSEDALSAAKNGIYAAADLQNVKLKHMQPCFSKIGDQYAVSPHLKEHVKFSYYNLLDASSANPPESIFGNFDIVFCCNLIMYYKKEYRLFILKKIERSLSQSGFLAVGEAERAFVKTNTGFQPVSFPVAVFHRQSDSCTDAKQPLETKFEIKE